MTTPTTGQVLKNMSAGLFATETAADEDRSSHAIVRRTVPVRFTDGGTAANTAGEKTVYINPMTVDNARLYGGSVEFPVAVTASTSAYATVSVYKRSLTGGTQTLVASATTETTGSGGIGTVAAWVSAPLTMVTPTAAMVLAPGESLTVQLAKTGSGVAIASATVDAFCQLLIEEAQGT